MPWEMKLTASSRVMSCCSRKYAAWLSRSAKIATSTLAPVTSSLPDDWTWMTARWITRWKAAVGRASWPFNCEDFALFLNEAPGAQLYLGVANTESGMNGAPHSPDFAADERAIGHGVRAMSGLLTDRLAALSSTAAQ